MKLDLLGITAHPDDAELSFGGTLLVHKEMVYKTGIIDLTEGELGTYPFSSDINLRFIIQSRFDLRCYFFV